MREELRNLWNEGRWNEFRGELMARFGKLTQDDWAMIRGQREVLLGLIEKRYAISRAQAEEQICAFERGCRAFAQALSSSGSSSSHPGSSPRRK